MKFITKIKNLVLPKEIDFFGELTEQSKITELIIEKLVHNYTVKDNNNIIDLIKKAKNSRKQKLKQLEKVFITPIDREAISKSYSQLYWIALSIEHLIKELEVFGINQLDEYQKILDLLQEQISELSIAYSLLNTKKYDTILKKVNHIIHLDNVLVLTYSKDLNKLFSKNDLTFIMKHKEVLNQLKEISKRIHFCANQMEDIVFKID